MTDERTELQYDTLEHISLDKMVITRSSIMTITWKARSHDCQRHRTFETTPESVDKASAQVVMRIMTQVMPPLRLQIA